MGAALSRTAVSGEARHPVRMVHLGLGAFHRAHQAWYTHQANAAGHASGDEERFGIAGFTGRRPHTATLLRRQDCLYTVLVRGTETDAAQICSSLSDARDGADLDALRRYLRDPGVTIVTLTVTEAGYHRAGDGRLNRSDAAVRADIAALRSADPRPTTAPGRLLAGLAARRAADAGGLAVVPCDNLPGNGAATRQVLLDLADEVDRSLREWIEGEVDFVSTVVDRITPASTDADAQTAARLTGFRDAAPVVTEPFTEWLLTDGFRQPRPPWEAAGAVLVDDVTPFELRKLWLLNGAHSLLAYAGLVRGHATVAAAIADPVCRGWVQEWWQQARRHIPLPDTALDAYQQALLERFGQPRIAHRLVQVAMDGSQKLPVRVGPVLRAELAAGRSPAPAARIVAAWLAHLRRGDVRDPQAPYLAEVAAAAPRAAAAAALRVVAEDLADDPSLVNLVADLAAEVGG